MGGSLTLSMRHPDGSVQHFDVWTNRVPSLMQDPTFLGRGTAFKDFMASAQKLSRYTLNEYGVILVDFMTKHVTSRQGYCDPEISCLDIHSDKEWLQDLLQAGADLTLSVYSFSTYMVEPLPTEVQSAILAAVPLDYRAYRKVCDAHPQNGMFQVREAHTGWTFDHKNLTPSHDKDAARDLRAVLNTWKKA